MSVPIPAGSGFENIDGEQIKTVSTRYFVYSIFAKNFLVSV